MEAKDGRMRSISEMLIGMNTIKLNSYQNFFERKVDSIKLFIYSNFRYKLKEKLK